jgi:NitT/TauT family transport system substrate-binding protein
MDFVNERLPIMMQRSHFIKGLAFGSAAIASPISVSAQSANTLRIATTPVQFYAEPYFGADAGAFSKVGYELAITPVANGPAVTSAMVGGSVDLGVIDLITAASALAKGLPLQLLASGAIYRAAEAWQIITVAKDSPLRTARDLEGRTIALPSVAGLALASTRGWLRKNGADPEKVHFVEYPQPTMAAALTRKTFDAAFIGEPYLAMDRNGSNEMRVFAHPLDSIGKDFTVTGWFSTRAWFDQDKRRAKAVIDAIYETARWANAHRTETASIIAQQSSLDPAKISGMIRCDYATSLDVGQLQPMFTSGFNDKLIPATDAGTLVPKLT